MNAKHKAARDEARAAGELMFKGAACRKGHTDSLRLTSNGQCVECKKAYRAPTHRKERQSFNIRKWTVETKYGLPWDEYNSMIRAHNDACGICGMLVVEGSGRMTSPHVDHCHVTGKVRGILCHKCNTALGGFQDSLEVLRRAVSYLEKHHVAS